MLHSDRPDIAIVGYDDQAMRGSPGNRVSVELKLNRALTECEIAANRELPDDYRLRLRADAPDRVVLEFIEVHKIPDWIEHVRRGLTSIQSSGYQAERTEDAAVQAAKETFKLVAFDVP